MRKKPALDFVELDKPALHSLLVAARHCPVEKPECCFVADKIFIPLQPVGWQAKGPVSNGLLSIPEAGRATGIAGQSDAPESALGSYEEPHQTNRLSLRTWIASSDRCGDRNATVRKSLPS